MKPTLADLSHLSNLNWWKGIASQIDWDPGCDDDDEEIQEVIIQSFYNEEEVILDWRGDVEFVTEYGLDIDDYYDLLFDFVKLNWNFISPHIKWKK